MRDRIYFVGEEALVAEISRGLPPGISLELDGRYPAMFRYKMKNCVLLDERGRLTVKGSAPRSRGIELFQRTSMEERLQLLLTGRRAEIPALVQHYLEISRRGT